jgi:hypothetical protein
VSALVDFALQFKLYSQGLKPVFRVLPMAPKTWRRIPGKINYSLVPIPLGEQQEKMARADDDEGEGGSGPPT